MSAPDTHSNGSQRQISDALLGGHDPANDRAVAMLHQMYPHEFSRWSIDSLAIVVSTIARVHLDRNWGRRKMLLLKWIDDNSDRLESYFTLIHLD
jgi:hypothetical protein